MQKNRSDAYGSIKICYIITKAYYITVTLLQLIWTSITPLVIWTQSQMTCLFKKYSRSDPANYCGIGVTATLSRIIPMIIMKRLRDAYNNMLDQSQYGFDQTQDVMVLSS